MVVTASDSLGETIRRALEDTRFYRVLVVNNKAAAIVKANEIGMPMALLDLALGADWALEIGQALRTIRPNINLVILCDASSDLSTFSSLSPWIMVNKPFRLSDFMNAISQPQKPRSAPQLDSANNAPVSKASETAQWMPWLGDPNKSAQHLAMLTLESSAQAALITKRSDLWAYAGGLSQNAAREVAQTIVRNWDDQKGTDLLRFIRLESTKAEHMVYASRIASDTALALIFDAETPFSTIRSQAGQLINNFVADRAPSHPSAPPVAEEDNDDVDIPSISNILADIPDPNPEPISLRGFTLPPQKESFDPNETRVSDLLSSVSVFSRDATPPPLAQTQESKSLIADEIVFNNMEVTAPSRPKPRPETPLPRPRPNVDNAVTRESPSTEAARKLTPEPISAGLYHLTYACLMIPRFASHSLTGDIAEHLSQWLPNICIAFGWRLEFLAVRPEYLQWVVNVKPNTSPGYLMRIMRQQTSEKIFANFPRLKRENPSGDFWASGYLIMGGSQPHPQQLVRDYIRQTRKNQGIDSAS